MNEKTRKYFKILIYCVVFELIWILLIIRGNFSPINYDLFLSIFIIFHLILTFLQLGEVLLPLKSKLLVGKNHFMYKNLFYLSSSTKNNADVWGEKNVHINSDVTKFFGFLTMLILNILVYVLYIFIT